MADFKQWRNFMFMPAPNRYRKDALTKSQIIAMQAADFTLSEWTPVGREISPFDWDEILVWERS